MEAVSISKISVSEIFNTSFYIYLSRMWLFFIIFLTLNTVNAVLLRFFLNFSPPFSPPHDSTNGFLLWLANYMVSIIIIFSLAFLVIWVLSSLAYSLTVKCALDILEGRKVDVRNNLLLILKLLKEILMIGFLTGTLIIFGLIFFIIPGFLIAIIFSLAIPALIYERWGVFGSLRRSKELTDGLWWKTFLLLIAALALIIMAYLFAELVTSALAQSITETVETIIITIAISLVEPIYPISISCFYCLLKSRKAYEPIHLKAAHPQRVREPEVKICHSCGQVLPYDAIYCPNCGIRVFHPF